jgi:hypothetical protein
MCVGMLGGRTARKKHPNLLFVLKLFVLKLNPLDWQHGMEER